MVAKVPKTAKAIASAAPISASVYQARWSGKEIFVPINLATKPPRENQTIRAALGDVIYFREWEGAISVQVSRPSACSTATRSCANGAAMLPLTSSAESIPRSIELIEEIGDRVWRKGGEKIAINMVE